MLKTFLIFLACAGLISFIGVAYAQEDGIVLESGFGDATFNHSTHSDYSCNDCHHIGDTDQKCTDCHTSDAEVDTKTAFHDNCITCHQEKDAGPQGCAECHEKE